MWSTTATLIASSVIVFFGFCRSSSKAPKTSQCNSNVFFSICKQLQSIFQDASYLGPASWQLVALASKNWTSESSNHRRSIAGPLLPFIRMTDKEKPDSGVDVHPHRRMNVRWMDHFRFLTKFGQWNDLIISQLQAIFQTFSSYPPLRKFLSS